MYINHTHTRTHTEHVCALCGMHVLYSKCTVFLCLDCFYSAHLLAAVLVLALVLLVLIAPNHTSPVEGDPLRSHPTAVD